MKSDSMTFPRARLTVAICLFVGWLGYLGFLVYQSRSQVVLSKPQFLSAQMYAVVELSVEPGIDGGEITVDKVVWSADKSNANITKLNLADLGDARGFRVAGKYLMPLARTRDGSWFIVPVPHYDARRAEDKRIYAWTTEVQAQASQLAAARE